MTGLNDAEILLAYNNAIIDAAYQSMREHRWVPIQL